MQQPTEMFLQLVERQNLGLTDNFYWQEPWFSERPGFNLVGQYGAWALHITTGLTLICRHPSMSTWAEFRNMIPAQQLVSLQNSGVNDSRFKYEFYHSCGVKTEQKGIFQTIIVDVLKHLTVYDQWIRYIQTQFVQGEYYNSGRYNRSVSPLRPPTYAHWIYEAQQTDLRIRELAARLVTMQAFPQQFGIKSLSDLVRETGRGSTRRVYTLKKALELPERWGQ